MYIILVAELHIFNLIKNIFTNVDYMSQYDDDESIDSARGSANINTQMASLNLLNNNHAAAAASISSSTGIKLGPVVTKKPFGGNSANTLNNLKKLPSNSSKVRSTPLTPEKVLFNDKTHIKKVNLK